jgi:hypothetical protein
LEKHEGLCGFVTATVLYLGHQGFDTGVFTFANDFTGLSHRV